MIYKTLSNLGVDLTCKRYMALLEKPPEKEQLISKLKEIKFFIDYSSLYNIDILMRFLVWAGKGKIERLN